MENKTTLTFAVLDLENADPADPKYRVTLSLDDTQAYEASGDVELLDDLEMSDDYITLDWDDARIFTATVMRKLTQRVMADYAGGDVTKIATIAPSELSEVIAKDPVVGAMKIFYDATFDTPDGPAQNHHIAVKLTDN